MFFNAGRLGEYIQSRKLEFTWKKKKEQGGLPSNSYLETMKQLQKDQDSYTISAITFKLNSGKKLTYGEMEYLRKNNPSLYAEAVKIARARQEYERKLQSCRTKEEVMRIQTGAMGGLIRESKSGGGGSDGGNMLMHLASLTDAHQTFVSSREYAALPRDHEEGKSPRKKVKVTPPAVSYHPPVFHGGSGVSKGERPSFTGPHGVPDSKGGRAHRRPDDEERKKTDIQV